MRIKFLPEAEVELASSMAEYDGLGSPGFGFSDEAERVLEQLSRFPFSGPEFGRVRRCLLDGYRFEVVYQPFPDHLLVIAIAHTSRRPGYWKRRLPKK